MTKEEFKGKIASIKEAYPEGKVIVVEGEGSGDSFDSFFSYNIDGEYKPRLESNKDLEDLLWGAVDSTGCSFCNDGARVEITIDLVNETVNTELYWKIQEESHGGTYNLSFED